MKKYAKLAMLTALVMQGAIFLGCKYEKVENEGHAPDKVVIHEH